MFSALSYPNIKGKERWMRQRLKGIRTTNAPKLSGAMRTGELHLT